MPKKEKLKFYSFICDQCATAHIEICPYCDQKGMLTATTDWLQPGQKQLNVWD
jgi:hypothetical protein